MQGPGLRFDRYDVLGPLGAGGMGEVVKARALGPHGFEKIVAIKRIRAEWSAQDAMAERFIREARIAARLQHANIVQVFDFGRHGDELFIVMEYVDGQSLDAILASLRAEGKRPTLAQALQIALDVSRALECAHTLEDEDGAPGGIIHRDVSPANVLVSRAGIVKLTDFGIASWSTQQGRTSLVAGKPLYMAPEQLRGEPLDGRADLFAVGVVLYEMLTGERPWKGMVDASPDATLEGMGYRPPSARLSGVPAELDALLARLLAPRAGGRVASARELTKEILQLSYDCRIVLDPSELTPLVREPAIADDAHAPTLPRYVSKVQTLVASGVSPEGVTLLRTDDEREAIAPPSSGAPLPAWAWAALAVLLLGAGTAAAVWVAVGDRGGGAQAHASDELGGGEGADPEAGGAEGRGEEDGHGVDGEAGADPEPSGDRAGEASTEPVRAGDVDGDRDRDEGDREAEVGREGRRRSAGDARHEDDRAVGDEGDGERDREGEGEGERPVRGDGDDVGDDGVERDVGGGGGGGAGGGDDDEREGDGDRERSPERGRGRPHAPAGRGQGGGRGPAERGRAPEARAGEGELDVFSRPWAEIWIDGERQPQNAPARGLRVPAGRHRVRLVNPVLGLSQERTVVVPSGGRAQLRVFLDQGGGASDE